MTKKQKRDWAIQKAVGILTENNPIDIMLLGKLHNKLKATELADIGLIIASQYSPEGCMTWQNVLEAE